MKLFGFGGKNKEFSFKCSDCGRWHKGAPSFAERKPVQYFDVPETDREERVDIDTDLCVIRPALDETNNPTFYFIRTTLEVPIHGMNDMFMWGVWVSVSDISYERYVGTMDDDQDGDGCFGWLTVSMVYYNMSGTGEAYENLACDVHWASNNRRPRLQIHECDHPLYYDQIDGITFDKAVEISRIAMHG